jgi:hypothetical protein
MSKGLDVGTSYIVMAKEVWHTKPMKQLETDRPGVVATPSIPPIAGDTEAQIQYKEFRDAFYVIKPSTPVATKMIEKGLQGKVFVRDDDGSFIILGHDAIEKAIERNESAKRPMYRGVISAKEKEAKRVLAFILQQVVGTAGSSGEKLVFCIPAQPADQGDEEFDVGYHEDVVTAILSECGYNARAINEAEAICYSELEAEDYTGIALSCGAGMVNCCVMLNGEPTVMFSTTKSGDWVDRMVAVAMGEPDSAVQAEKEHGDFTLGQPNDNPVLAAVCSYYERLIDYTAKNLTAAMAGHKALPKFKEPLPVVVAGGTSRPKGFVELLEKKLADSEFPIPIKEVRRAADPLHAVARGCLIAAKIL